MIKKTEKIYYKYLIEVCHLLGHLDDEPNKNLVFKEKPNNMGLYLGKVQNYQKNKGYVTLKLREKLGVGDTISIDG